MYQVFYDLILHIPIQLGWEHHSHLPFSSVLCIPVGPVVSNPAPIPSSTAPHHLFYSTYNVPLCSTVSTVYHLVDITLLY